VVDDELDRLQRVDAIGSPPSDDAVAHRREIHHAGTPVKSCSRHARRHEGDLPLDAAPRRPTRQRRMSSAFTKRAVLAAQQVLEQDLHRVRQFHFRPQREPGRDPGVQPTRRHDHAVGEGCRRPDGARNDALRVEVGERTLHRVEPHPVDATAGLDKRHDPPVGGEVEQHGEVGRERVCPCPSVEPACRGFHADAGRHVPAHGRTGVDAAVGAVGSQPAENVDGAGAGPFASRGRRLSHHRADQKEHPGGCRDAQNKQSCHEMTRNPSPSIRPGTDSGGFARRLRGAAFASSDVP
jgi:hypothetical protein